MSQSLSSRNARSVSNYLTTDIEHALHKNSKCMVKFDQTLF